MANFLRLIQTLVLSLIVSGAADKSFDGGMNRMGLQVAQYHLAHAGAEAGADAAFRFWNSHDPESVRQCVADQYCDLAFSGLADHVVKKAVAEDDRGADCDYECWLNHISRVTAQATRYGFVRAVILFSTYSRGPASPFEPTDQMVDFVAHLLRYEKDDRVKEHKLNRAMDSWAAESHKLQWGLHRRAPVHARHAEAPYANLTRTNTTTLLESNTTTAVGSPRGSRFLEAFFHQRTCMGDSFLCPLNEGDRLQVASTHAFLSAMGKDSGLSDRNPLHLVVAMLRKAYGPRDGLWTVIGHPRSQKAGGGLRKAAVEYIAQENRDVSAVHALTSKAIVPVMRYSTEAFERETGRIWATTLQRDMTATLDSGMQGLGYMVFHQLDDMGNSLHDRVYVCQARDLEDPSKMIWVHVHGPANDGAPEESVGPRLASYPHAVAPRDAAVPAAPRGDDEAKRESSRRSEPVHRWPVSVRRLLGGTTAFSGSAPVSALAPDQIAQTAEDGLGNLVKDSMGQPRLRAVPLVAGTAKGHPVMLAVDAAPQFLDGATSVAALRANRPNGDPIVSQGGFKVGEFVANQNPTRDRLVMSKSSRSIHWWDEVAADQLRPGEPYGPRPLPPGAGQGRWPSIYAAERNARRLAAQAQALADTVERATRVSVNGFGIVLTGAAVGLTIWDIKEKFQAFVKSDEDRVCPHPPVYTELWTPTMATITEVISPCTKKAPHGDGTKTIPAAFLYGASRPSLTAEAQTTTNATADEMVELCTEVELPPGWVWNLLSDHPCPVPTPVECTDSWFHLHVNELPVGIRYPNYCSTADVTGPARAAQMGCQPDFRSDECKRTFGLDEKWRKQRERAREKAIKEHREWMEEQEEADDED